MKKLIFAAVVVLLAISSLVSCDFFAHVKYDVAVSYAVCYPDTVIQYDTVFTCDAPAEDYENEPVKVYTSSYKGSNFVAIRPGWNDFSATTAPIRVLRFKNIDEHKGNLSRSEEEFIRKCYNK